jgi:hypothetical protein
MGAREPGQDRKVAAFIGIVRVPQTAWSSPHSAAFSSPGTQSPEFGADVALSATIAPNFGRVGGSREGRSASWCEAFGKGDEAGGVDLVGDGCERRGGTAPVPLVDRAHVDVGHEGRDLAEEQCVGELGLQRR